VRLSQNITQVQLKSQPVDPSHSARHNPASMDGDPALDELGNHCFGCGPSNSQGLHLRFTSDISDPTHLTTTAHLQLTRLHEGPPGYIHGGIVATLLDEAMSKLNRPLNVLAMTRHMEIDYLRPAPLHQPLVLIATHLERSINSNGFPGRKLFHQAELQLPNGTVLARGKGLFIVISETHLTLPATTP
jgi:acyl-coenzyme A thioesterase PaaI-like protein